VLRAVRLLPDAVKIGVEAETALPSVQEEEQISNGAAPDKSAPASGRTASDFGKTQIQIPARQESGAKGAPPDPLKDLKNQMESLQKNLSDAETARTRLLEKITSLETELARFKEASAQKERETAASIDAVKAQACTEGRAQGHAEGVESGYKAGLEKAHAEISENYKEKFTGLAELLEGVSAKLEAHFADLAALNEPRMLRLWQEMLEKMLQREMILEPEGLLDVLSGILTRLSDKNHILIYVSPDDLALMQERLHQGEFEDVLRGVKHLELKPDASVDKGSCIVETNLGVYDARWRTQLDQIDTEIEKLFQKLGKPPKPKEVARRVRKGSKPEETPAPVPESEPVQVAPAQPEQTVPEQTNGNAKPAAKKKVSSKKKEETAKKAEAADG
jgi:flagellar assembly protein FliH